MSRKPDPRDAPFKRTVTREDVETSNDLKVPRRGLQEAADKRGYWRGKQLEPGATPETIAYGKERETSASHTMVLAKDRIESVEASERRLGKVADFSALFDDLLRTNQAANMDDAIAYLNEHAKKDRDAYLLNGRRLANTYKNIETYLARAKKRMRRNNTRSE